ncbi:MAG: right-handed parallel beta-helix repeat-containing protein [bacterium]|nr:right-handed parallel beta-helix repeat-containing protein [bacterium]
MNRIFNRPSVLIWVSAAAMILSVLPAAQAKEFKVANEYQTIQSAIAAASDGDVIIIQPGIYQEQIDFLGKGITVKSIDPNDPDTIASTIIDGGKAGSVVTFSWGEGKNSVLSGVTIRNGQPRQPFSKGGGIFCQSSSPLIKKCVIRSNSAPFGGGIYCLEASPIVANCIIVENTGSEKGGGIFVDSFSSPLLIQCVVSKNSAPYGAGMYSHAHSSPLVINSIFWDNSLQQIDTDGQLSYLRFSYCDIQHSGGHWPGFGNIDSDPLFINPEGGDYRLQSSSACRDGGHPRLVDADGSRSDIGAWGGDVGIDCAALCTIRVALDGSGDFASIQEAIDWALPGDTVIVYPGRWRENLILAGKNLSILSQSGPSSTIIDGAQAGSAVALINVGPESRIEGFSIQNGLTPRCGGGIYCLNSSAIISSCRVIQNAAAESGGGISCEYNSSPTITNCLISANSALSGGGIFFERSRPTLIDCQITKNSATGSFLYESGEEDFHGGGGLFCYNSAALISRCTISDNAAPCGGGISCFGSMCYQPKIIDCTISHNLASHRGGGIYYQCDALEISNSTIAGNSADCGGGIYCTWPITGFTTHWTIVNCVLALNSARLGAGINCSGYSAYSANAYSAPEYNFPAPKIANCTIIGNSASLSGGGILADLASPTVTNCILWGNSPNEVDNHLSRMSTLSHQREYRRPGSRVLNRIPSGSLTINYSDIQGGYQGMGNISLPPLFVDPGRGDYHLRYGSPCIDAGEDPKIPEAENDRDGEPRPWDGDSDGVAGHDMGAYEFRGFAPPIIWISLGVYPKERASLLIDRKIQLVVLGREGFDVTAIDPATILLGRCGLRESIAPFSWSYTDISAESAASPDRRHQSSGDGYQDLLLTFNNQEFMRKLAPKDALEDTICLTLSGFLQDGSLIKGQLNIAPIRRSLGHFHFEPFSFPFLFGDLAY